MAPSETEQEAPLTLPRLEFPDQAVYPNYVLLNGQVYNLERVNCDAKQAMEAVSEFYKQQHELRAKVLEDSVVGVLRENDNRELRHLVRARERGSIAIPSDMFDKTLMAKNGLLWEIRTVLYEPEEIKADYDYIDQMGVLRSPEAQAFYAPWEGKGNIIINIKCPFKTVIDFRYCAEANSIYMDERTFHAMHDARLCTNEVSAERIWTGHQNVEFARYVNRINVFSLATSTISVTNILTRRREDFHIKQLLNPANVLSIAEEARSQWRT